MKRKTINYKFLMNKIKLFKKKVKEKIVKLAKIVKKVKNTKKKNKINQIFLIIKKEKKVRHKL
jgi:hypothetical protein